MADSSQQETDPKLKELETTLQEQTQVISGLENHLQLVQKELGQFKEQIHKLYTKIVTTCKSCQTEYDILAHHYSIGLFHNIVFVKCPKCQTEMAVDPKEGVKRE